MTLGIMQPYFLPYIGYWQLLAAVDRFVVYDNIEYTKKGWINRNRFLQNGAAAYFTVPLKKAADHLTVAEREIAPDFDRGKVLRALAAAYRKAPYFADVFPLVERIIQTPLTNLFAYIYQSLVEMAAFLEIRTPMVISSAIAIDHALRAEQKVLALCKAMGATRYVNPAAGGTLYSAARFRASSVELALLQAKIVEYPQGTGPFVPSLSIVDVLMFNGKASVAQMVGQADVVAATV